MIVPPFPLPTAEVYARFDRHPRRPVGRPDSRQVLHRLRSGRASLELRNDLEPPVFALHPDLERAKRSLSAAGALMCGLSGSGSALFGLFVAPSTPRRLAEEWRARGWEAQACRLLGGAAWRSRFADGPPRQRLSAGDRGG